MKAIIITALLIIDIFYLSGQSINKKNRFLIAININSCNFCNKSLATWVDEGSIKDVGFLLSDNDVTREQAKSFLDELLGYPTKIIIDTKLYNKVASQISFFKMPHLIVLDSSESVVFKAPIDSIDSYKDILQSLKYRIRNIRKIDNERLRKIIGLKSINKIKNHLFITGWQNSDKVYIYDIKKESLDSIYYYSNDSLIGYLMYLNGDSGINITALKQMFKTYKLPYSLIQFSVHPVVDENQFYSIIDLLYFNPDNFNDTISPKWGSFAFSYNPKTKATFIYDVKRWLKDSVEELLFDDYSFDYQYQVSFNDSMWLFGGKKKSNSGYSLQKPFYFYQKQKTKPLLSFTGNYMLFKFDSIKTFKGDLMTLPRQTHPYKLKYPYFLFNQSPLIYNQSDKSVFNVLTINKNIDWIYDFNVTLNTIKLLVKEGSVCSLYTLNKRDFSVLNKEVFERFNSIGSIVLDDNNIYYMEKSGQLILLESKSN